eukprot:Gregarina_sp_Poly_1__411@NODE_10_length_23460_cov_121_463087_g8_i1_p8_GENE_NODE_10_length_23460_cov_121_463087_g8_i1NODE_10_length_23460_cov_121_463087_g8_i1_p8_ORF_typecomplete_len367_score47_85ArfGap/PF01412_18/1_6e39_NODE_10_length_23460_cov_121_463087_g8_i154346534
MKSAGKRQIGAKATLEAIAKRPENQQCADCHIAGPRWVSINIGVFICIDCSGFHRDLGTHISKIKSITLDDWQHDVVEFIGGLGNNVCNDYYEANLPINYSRPKPKSPLLRDFIQRKYAAKEWIPQGSVFSPAELLREGKSALGPGVAKFGPGPQCSATLEKPISGKSRQQAGKNRQLATKKSHRSGHTASISPLLDDVVFEATPNQSDAVKYQQKANTELGTQEDTQDLLADFWDSGPSTQRSNVPPSFSSPQSLGYVLEAPSFRRVQEAKTAGAKEAQVQCISDPVSLCLGPPTFQPVFPATVESGPADIDSWFTETAVSNFGTAEQRWSSNQHASKHIDESQEDSFASAVNRNLDQLSILTSR